MKSLITGAAGFIGSNLVKLLLDNDFKVIGIDNFITGSAKNVESFKDNKKFTFIKADVVDFDFHQLDPVDILFHLASPASPKAYGKYPIETLMVNSLGTKKVLDYLKKLNQGVFVLASTSEVYGDPLVHPQKEDYFGNVNPVGWRACYDEGKRFAEALATTYHRAHKLDVRIARIFNTYGPNMEKDDGRVISNFITQSLTNSPLTIYGDGSQTRSFCFVSDMVSALYLLATKQGISGEIINLGNPDERTILEIAKLIKILAKSTSEIVFQDKMADDPKKRKPDIQKAREILGWEPKINLENGLIETLEYFKNRF